MKPHEDWDVNLAGMIGDGWYVSKVTPAARFDVDADWRLQIERNGLLVGEAAQTRGGAEFSFSFDSALDEADFRTAAVRHNLVPDDPMLEPGDAVIALAYAHQRYLEACLSQAPQVKGIEAARVRYIENFSHDAAASVPSVSLAPKGPKKGGSLGL